MTVIGLLRYAQLIHKESNNVLNIEGLFAGWLCATGLMIVGNFQVRKQGQNDSFFQYDSLKSITIHSVFIYSFISEFLHKHHVGYLLFYSTTLIYLQESNILKYTLMDCDGFNSFRTLFLID